MSTPTPASFPANFPGRHKQLGTHVSRRSGASSAAALAILGALAHVVGAKESSHVMASVAGGASVIKDGQRGEAIWVKVPAALVAEDSPCQAQDCYAVCATLPADVRASLSLNTPCEPGWNYPKGLGGYPDATSKVLTEREGKQSGHLYASEYFCAQPRSTAFVHWWDKSTGLFRVVPDVPACAPGPDGSFKAYYPYNVAANEGRVGGVQARAFLDRTNLHVLASKGGVLAWARGVPQHVAEHVQLGKPSVDPSKSPELGAPQVVYTAQGDVSGALALFDGPFKQGADAEDPPAVTALAASTKQEYAHFLGGARTIPAQELPEEDGFVITDDDSDDDPDYIDPPPLTDAEEEELDLLVEEVEPEDLGTEGADGTIKAVQIVGSYHSPMDITEWETLLSVDEKKARIIKLIERWFTQQEMRTTDDEGNEHVSTLSLKEFALEQILLRLFRSYKDPLLRHKYHKKAYEWIAKFARKRCCGTLEETDDCDDEQLRFCYEGAVAWHDPNAVVLWSHPDEAAPWDLADNQMQLLIDRGGVSQQAAEAARRLAEESGLNTVFPNYEFMSSKYRREKAQKRLGAKLTEHVFISPSAYGTEAACVPVDTVFEYLSNDAGVAEEVVELTDVDATVMYFDNDAVLTEEGVLASVGRLLYRDTHMPRPAAIALARSALREPTRDEPALELRPRWRPRGADEDVPPVAILRFKMQGERVAGGFGGYVGGFCSESIVDDLRAAASEMSDRRAAEAEPRPLPELQIKAVTHFAVRVFVTNMDGFAALNKQSRGTHEFQMVTTVALRLLTHANNRGTNIVMPLCLYPGDDNSINFRIVERGASLGQEMIRACSHPRPDPLRGRTSIVYCNEGWAIDAKAASYNGGWPQWVSNIDKPVGLDVCRKLELRLRATETCAAASRTELIADAHAAGATWRQTLDGAPTRDDACDAGLEPTVVVNGIFADVNDEVAYFVTRTARIQTALHWAVLLLPQPIISGITTAVGLLRSNARRSTARQALDVMKQVEPSLKRFKRGTSPVAIYTQVGGPDPLRKLAAAAHKMWAVFSELLSRLGEAGGCPLGLPAVAGHCLGGTDDPLTIDLKPMEAAVSHVELLLERARRSTYWPNDKSAKITKFHADGHPGAAKLWTELVEGKEAQLNDLGQSLSCPPESFLNKQQQLAEGAMQANDEIKEALGGGVDESGEGLFRLLKKMVDVTFGKRGESLVSDEVLTSFHKAFELERSCFLPGARGSKAFCSYVGGLLHQGRLRSGLGMAVNKVTLGKAHAYKYVHEDPPRGSYARQPDSSDLNKGHFEDGQTTVQSCISAVFKKANVKHGGIQFAAASSSQSGRLCLKQGDGPVFDAFFGSLTKVDPTTHTVPIPEPLDVSICFPPLERELHRHLTILMSFAIRLIEAEVPEAQFDMPCDELSELAVETADALESALDVLHPILHSKNGHTVDWNVLSPHILLAHFLRRDFGRMCKGPITLGMLTESGFETFHIFSKGAIQHHGAPARWKNQNRMFHALRRLLRQKHALLLQRGRLAKKARAARRRWKAQAPALKGLAVWAGEAISFVKGCPTDETCSAYVLFQSDLHASPMLTLDNSDEAIDGCEEDEAVAAATAASPTIDSLADQDAAGQTAPQMFVAPTCTDADGSADPDDTQAQSDEEATCEQRDLENACFAETCEYTVTCREERGEGPGGQREEEAMMAAIHAARNPDAAPPLQFKVGDMVQVNFGDDGWGPPGPVTKVWTRLRLYDVRTEWGWEKKVDPSDLRAPE